MLNLKELISKSTHESRAKIAEVEDLLNAKKNLLKEFHLEKDLKELAREIDWEGLIRARKLILEIRYLENNGKADEECDYEKETGNPNHCKGLVGLGNGLGKLDQEIIGASTEHDEKFYLVKYLRLLAWNGKVPDVNNAINKVKNGEDDLLKGIDLEVKLNYYKEHFEGWGNLVGLYAWELNAYKAICEELGKHSKETAQDWANKLKTIDGLSGISINDAWKDEWTSLPNFKKVAQVENLVKEVFGSNNKVKSEFIAKATTKKPSLTNLEEVMKEKPREIISLIELYKYDNLDDSATNEKDKKKTQVKRRIAKALNKTKESDLPDSDIPENLVKVRLGELKIETSKYYTADLKEITNKKDNNEEQENKKPFLRWDNIWLYAIGVLVVGIICSFIFWDKLVSLFGGDKEENN